MTTTRVKKRHHRNLNFPWRKFAKTLGFTVLLATLIFGVTRLQNTEYFPIKAVKIYGLSHVDHGAMQTLITPFVGKGFFAVNVDRLKETLLQMPWVADVMVRRLWPDQVMITVHEKKPIARWNDTSLLSAAGELFSPPIATYPPGLPEFTGPSGEQVSMSENYDKMNELLMPLHLKITQLALTPTLAWTLTLDNGIKLNLGHKDVLTRVNHFVKVYPEIVGNRGSDVEYIDLRYSNGVAVRWKAVK